MRSGTEYTIISREVHDRTAGTLQEQVQLADHGPKCTASLLITILLYAASPITSIYDACQRLAAAPSDQAVRDALRATLPPIKELERRLNGGLAADLPRALRRRRYPLAIDLTLIPYHGEPYRSPEEIYRGEPRSGTSHFHAYATAYVICDGRHLRRPWQLRQAWETAGPSNPGLCLLGLSAAVVRVDSRNLPSAFRHRNHLPTDESGPHPHLRAIRSCGCCSWEWP